MTALPRERTADGVEILTLIPNPSKPRGGVVVLDAWLIDELLRAFDAIAKGPAPTGFILRSGSPRVFVAGADLAEIDALDDPGLDAYLRRGAEAFGRIPALPCASVAAINAAALGGGLEIAMHCDALIGVATAVGAKPYRVGLPEAGLGICPGWGGTQMLPARIDPALAIERTATGETWASDALPEGLFAALATDAGRLLESASAWLRSHPRTASRSSPVAIEGGNRDRVAAGLAAVRTKMAARHDGGSPGEAADAVLDAVRIGLATGWTDAIAAERRHLVRLRHTPAARAKLEAFLTKA